ncbi:hypothetical protein F4861DRAFT_544068 [Xylaria intraflava]|nr:hypothetical protein F4861DRAFT_544068 [Xylaria intraflava]
MTTKSTTESNPIALWVCNGILILTILLRLALRKWRRQALTLGDFWTVVALLFNGLRVAGDYYADQYGTPLSMSILHVQALAKGDGVHELALTAQERSNLVLAGKLAVASRAAIVVVLWSLKMAIMDILRALLRKLRYEWLIAYAAYTVLGVTFLGATLSVFLECQELSLNWKLFPDPDKCANGSLWIITYEISNIVTDGMLFFLLVISIIAAQVTKWERALLSIFALGAILIAVNIIRLIEGLPFTDVLFNRIVWGSVEVAVAASVATLPSIYSLLRRDAENQQSESRRKIYRSPRIPPITPDERDAIGQELQSQQHPATWDYDFPWDTSPPTEADSKDKATNPAPQASIPSSTTEEENQDSWAGPKSPLDTSFQSARPCSALPTMDELSGWVELDDVDPRDLCGMASPEPNDAEYRGGQIFLATEINQEADRLWNVEERPHIVTIRGRRDEFEPEAAGTTEHDDA